MIRVSRIRPRDPASEGWILENVYEMRIDLGADTDVLDDYGDGFINGLSLYVGELHASPSKLEDEYGEDFKFWENQPPDTPWTSQEPLPEPATAILFGISEIAVLARNRKD